MVQPSPALQLAVDVISISCIPDLKRRFCHRIWVVAPTGPLDDGAYDSNVEYVRGESETCSAPLLETHLGRDLRQFDPGGWKLHLYQERQPASAGLSDRFTQQD